MATRALSSLFGIVLAGGSGTRFWPLSRSQYPKPILRLLGADSLLQATLARLLPVIPPDRLAVVTTVSQAEIIRRDLLRQDLAGIKLWLEPEGKNTAPAVALAAAFLKGEASLEIMAVFPVDHHILDLKAFHQALACGARLAQEGWLVTFGVTPRRPETGYGYLKAGKALSSGGRLVLAFVEKPDLLRARAFLEEGDYYWNSGIFLFRRATFLAALARHLPEVYRELADVTPETPLPALRAIYQRLPSVSLDHGIMEEAKNVAMVPLDVGWCEVGSLSAFFDLYPSDSRGNVLLGRVLDLESRDSLVVSKGRLVATLGLEGMVVVDTSDATLVCPRHRTQEVTHLVAELLRRKHREVRVHPAVERPWGRATVLHTGIGYQVEGLEVYPGRSLSFQTVQRPPQYWIVVQGMAQLTLGSKLIVLSCQEGIHIPAGSSPRLKNPGPDHLVLICVQFGEKGEFMAADNHF